MREARRLDVSTETRNWKSWQIGVTWGDFVYFGKDAVLRKINKLGWAMDLDCDDQLHASARVFRDGVMDGVLHGEPLFVRPTCGEQIKNADIREWRSPLSLSEVLNLKCESENSSVRAHDEEKLCKLVLLCGLPVECKLFWSLFCLCLKTYITFMADLFKIYKG